jgi:enediyne biosynthesis protein E4
MPPVVPVALFADVAVQAGIHFNHTNGATGNFRFVEFSPAGCAFLDYDNDGRLDILLLQSGSAEPNAYPSNAPARPHCVLYHNNGDGTFTDVTAGSGLDRDLGYAQGVAVGDFDNDGYDDLFITAYGGNHLLHNERGTGRFKDVTAQWGLDKLHSTGYATSAAFGDYDNDGKLDLYVCYYAPWTPDQDQPCYNEQKLRDYCSPESFPPDTHRLYHNEGDHYRDVSERAGITKAQGRGLAVAFVDVDGDGRQDIFVANDLKPNMLWHNNGDGTFTERAKQAGCAYSEEGAVMAGMGIAAADIDGTGRESLFVSNFSGMPNTLYSNMGGGLLRNDSMMSGLALPHMKFLAFGCAFLDYDADGRPDLMVNNGSVYVHAETRLDGATYRERKQLFHNEGGGSFKEVTDPGLLGDLSVPTVGRGLAVGDYDNDGRLDVLCSNQNGPAQLFHNQDRSGHHWVSFKTVGVRSNRDGLHARFALTAGGRTQTAVVRAASSYLSSSDRRVYFGLGAAARIDRVAIHWPSGVSETLRNVATDACYVVTEGKGITSRLPHR